jgi:hypothetical protein
MLHAVFGSRQDESLNQSPDRCFPPHKSQSKSALCFRLTTPTQPACTWHLQDTAGECIGLKVNLARERCARRWSAGRACLQTPSRCRFLFPPMFIGCRSGDTVGGLVGVTCVRRDSWLPFGVAPPCLGTLAS